MTNVNKGCSYQDTSSEVLASKEYLLGYLQPLQLLGRYRKSSTYSVISIVL